MRLAVRYVPPQSATAGWRSQGVVAALLCGSAGRLAARPRDCDGNVACQRITRGRTTITAGARSVPRRSPAVDDLRPKERCALLGCSVSSRHHSRPSLRSPVWEAWWTSATSRPIWRRRGRLPGGASWAPFCFGPRADCVRGPRAGLAATAVRRGAPVRALAHPVAAGVASPRR